MRWIVTDDVYAETWRRLLEFANEELTLDEVMRRHGPASSSSMHSNYEKQATQARVCVLQAREYFDAARASSLVTSPNHAYYGAVSLASLMMLILGDGRSSLDYLRRDRRNRHHGLEFHTECNAKSAAKGISLVEKSHALVLDRGHFKNWYASLPESGPVCALVQLEKSGTTSATMKQIGSYPAQPFDALVGVKTDLASILKYLPDLEADLSRFGLRTIRSRTTHEILIRESGWVINTWRLHGCRNLEERDALLAEFRVEPRFASGLQFRGEADSLAGVVTLTFRSEDQVKFHWPNSRDSMNHQTFSYAGGADTHEIVDLYLIAYQLSMLARYFPDIWMSCIESQCRAAKLIEQSIELVIKKFPMLTLSTISPANTIVSTHRPPWMD